MRRYVTVFLESCLLGYVFVLLVSRGRGLEDFVCGVGVFWQSEFRALALLTTSEEYYVDFTVFISIAQFQNLLVVEVCKF